ncbi:hypothetical protein [Scleromatobacter humisilvae]|uniref:Uncharacterized protein n=1 Tax=Scleromatobacter humisilvae TaxID=2897159 RepID=A0A9X2C022_9BURK|nr:hypothetical protein [Scleromatobacter humisilvae]MCK9687273.1 hypothetical protein [Scleromatobacter humisilvae]
MAIWQLRTAPADKFAPLAPTEAQAMSGTFEARGKPLQWKKRQKVSVFQEPKKKAALPRADVSLLMSGALVLNQKAHDALGPFLQEFGQLLELDVGGSTEYFYNVTNVVDCIDPERSEKRSTGVIVKEAFREGATPTEPSIFKDPRTVGTRMYVNLAAKERLDSLASSAGLTGLEFVELGEH